MASTTRNKKTLPKGWTVRDSGTPYRNGNDAWGRKAGGGSSTTPKYRRSSYRCEQTGERREDNRRYRNKAKNLTRTGNWDDIAPPTRTSGWLSW